MERGTPGQCSPCRVTNRGALTRWSSEDSSHAGGELHVAGRKLHKLLGAAAHRREHYTLRRKRT